MSLLVMHYGLEFFSKRNPNKIAIMMGEDSLTFSELNTRANRVANYLLSKGFEKGDKVATFLDNCLEYPEIIYGCSKAGLVLVPINFRLTSSEALHLIKHSKSKVLFISERIYNNLKDSKKEYEKILDGNLIVITDEVSQSKRFEEILEGVSEFNPNKVVTEYDTFCIGYTSGTTGVPKGALISHRARTLLLLAAAIEYQLGENDINITPGAIYHAAPIIFMLMAINLGATSVIMKAFDAEEMLKLIEKYKTTNAFVAPTMLQFIHQLPKEIKNKYNLNTMKAIVSAGAPLSTMAKKETTALFGSNVLHEFYGSTEAGWNTNLRPEDQMRKPRSCGKAVLGWDVKLIDDQNNEVKEPNTVGEIFVKGDYMFDGYLDNPEATESAFNGEWFSAGDLGECDDEGYFYIVGRKKDMIISGGANIYPEEIEDCLHGCPEINDVAVIGIPDETWGEVVTAVVCLNAAQKLSEDDIKNYCEGKISSYKKPRKIIFVEQIPRNPSGKILKNELRKSFC